ncbi:hypothetical protein NUW54_g13875 [Trametes sanguinea]|uniref:Uncharacterized protein n=1 Tax=Trametes sanguinea TaxID=158606 RepID=A0ACC1MHK5_9APHY|nr:hypothetical protein NUW54_g13875 [Trametes sanguinea]
MGEVGFARMARRDGARLLQVAYGARYGAAATVDARAESALAGQRPSRLGGSLEAWSLSRSGGAAVFAAAAQKPSAPRLSRARARWFGQMSTVLSILFVRMDAITTRSPWSAGAAALATLEPRSFDGI